MLKGLIVGLDGRAMTPWLSSPYKGRRYPYYVPQKDIASGAGKSGLPRLAAHQVHRVVWHHLRTSLRDPEDWFKGLPPALTAHPTFERHLIADRLRNLESVIDLLFPELKTRLFRQLVQQVVVEKRTLLVRVSTKGIIDLILELLDEDYLKALELKFEKKRNDVEGVFIFISLITPSIALTHPQPPSASLRQRSVRQKRGCFLRLAYEKINPLDWSASKPLI